MIAKQLRRIRAMKMVYLQMFLMVISGFLGNM